MASALRSIKRGMKAPSTVDPKLLEMVHSRGFADGSKAQREADIEYVVRLMEDLESVPGVGKKTADKVREYFKAKFNSGGKNGI